MNRRVVRALAATLALAAAAQLVEPLGAQSQAPSSGIPNLAGRWKRRGPIEGRPGNTSPVPLARARAIGFSRAFDEVLLPGYDCSPVAVPVLLNDNYNFEIVQQRDRVILRYEKDDIVRPVWLEGFGHQKPSVYDFTIQGHATGRYEKNQLVIVTTQFVFDPRGIHDSYIPSSTRKKVTERYWRDGDRLRMESVTEDPLILKAPYPYHFEWEPMKTPLVPFDCDPEASSFDRQFYETQKYQDPDWVKLPPIEEQ